MLVVLREQESGNRTPQHVCSIGTTPESSAPDLALSATYRSNAILHQETLSFMSLGLLSDRAQQSHLPPKTDPLCLLLTYLGKPFPPLVQLLVPPGGSQPPHLLGRHRPQDRLVGPFALLCASRALRERDGCVCERGETEKEAGETDSTRRDNG